MSESESKLPQGTMNDAINAVYPLIPTDGSSVGQRLEIAKAIVEAVLQATQQSEDATHKLRLRLGDVKNFALALLRGHEGDSIATDIANALLRLVGSSTQQSEDSPEHRELVEKLENTRGNMFRTFAQVDSLFDECISALREKAPQQALRVPTESQLRAALEAYSDHSAYVSTVALFAAVEAAFRAE